MNTFHEAATEHDQFYKAATKISAVLSLKLYFFLKAFDL